MTIGRMLTLPLWVALGLVQVLVIPVGAAALAWWLASTPWALGITVAALFYLLCIRWAARAAHGGLVRMVAARAVARSEMRAAVRESKRARLDEDQVPTVYAGTSEVRAS
ncbi:hypothetical protein [Umezawaea sp. NPDC059074]|uniref:hypothetical protein n=1 Tax=Umezawaea sp. NPDC059074 TaxID=3346716 RepID=UPI0036CBBC6C